MLQATLYTGPHQTDGGPVSNSRTAGPSWSGLLSSLSRVGTTWLQGSRCDRLDDHLLQDIGLNRADYVALRCD